MNDDRPQFAPPTEDELPFIDAEALVIDKPCGLPVSRPRAGGFSLDDWGKDLCFGYYRLPQAVHRLDQDTSGCLLMSRNPKAHKAYAAAFEKSLVKKSYIAILPVSVAEDQGVIDMALVKRSDAAKGWAIYPAKNGEKGAKSAITHWRKLAEHDGKTLLLLQPETGRTHQLRAHCLWALGSAIIGDAVYGHLQSGASGKPNLSARPQMMLHAIKLSMPREKKDDINVQSKWPERFAEAGFAEMDISE